MRRKHAFPATFFIINERLHSPPYGTMFCAAPILSPGPGPSFPPSPSPQPVNQGSWLSPDGRQAVSHQQWKQGLILCVSLLLFMPTCLLKFFHLAVPVASPGSPPPPLSSSTVPLQFLFSPLRCCLRGQHLSRGGQTPSRMATVVPWALALSPPRLECPVSLINKSDLVLTGLCICPLSGWWINMSRVGAGTVWG